MPHAHRILGGKTPRDCGDPSREEAAVGKESSGRPRVQAQFALPKLAPRVSTTELDEQLCGMPVQAPRAHPDRQREQPPLAPAGGIPLREEHRAEPRGVGLIPGREHARNVLGLVALADDRLAAGRRGEAGCGELCRLRAGQQKGGRAGIE